MFAISYVRLIVVGIVLAVVTGAGVATYRAGAKSVQTKWDADKLAAINQAEVLKLARMGVIEKSAAKYEGKAEKVRIITRTIIKEVEKYAPANLPLLPATFRLFHDAAAAGEEIDDSKISASAPVAPAVVARTVAANYGTCNDEKQRLEALQEIVKKLVEQ